MTRDQFRFFTFGMMAGGGIVVVLMATIFH